MKNNGIYNASPLHTFIRAHTVATTYESNGHKYELTACQQRYFHRKFETIFAVSVSFENGCQLDETSDFNFKHMLLKVYKLLWWHALATHFIHNGIQFESVLRVGANQLRKNMTATYMNQHWRSHENTPQSFECRRQPV